MKYKTNKKKDVESDKIKRISRNHIQSETDKTNSDSCNHSYLEYKHNKDDNKSSSKTSSELAHEKLMEMDLSDENLTTEDFSIEMVSMEYPFENTSP
jgi:hypothetical protein